MKHRVVVCGTGTEVGKTHVACALIAHLVATGEAVAGLKPIESGVDGTSETDSAHLARHAGGEDLGACFAFHDPVSPHLAARREARAIELDPIRRWVADHDAPWQVVETAGGLLSPLSPELTNLDLALALSPTSLVLCAPDRLGVLHDVAATLLALGQAGLADRTVVALSAPPEPDDSTGTNGTELDTLGRADRPAVFPRALTTDASTQQAAALLSARIAEVERLLPA
ncbi:MAG: dethiobiotin synthase [Deltaproteobacteria bacterium]|nr:dethiobiotin synthase [Deltaproteobacteria bacterium]